MMPSCTLATAGESVVTVMSAPTGIMHDGCSAGPRPVSISTRHMRHMPTGSMRGW